MLPWEPDFTAHGPLQNYTCLMVEVSMATFLFREYRTWTEYATSLLNVCIDSCDISMVNVHIRDTGDPIVGSSVVFASGEYIPIEFSSHNALD